MTRLETTTAALLALGFVSIGGAVLIGASTLDRRAELTAAPFACTTDAECAATPPCATKPGCDGSPATEPYRLVGYGCAGSTAPLYRDEEDEFPAEGCERIEATF